MASTHHLSTLPARETTVISGRAASHHRDRRERLQASGVVPSALPPDPAGGPPAWVTRCSTFAPEWKRIIAGYAATHLMKYGDVAQMGSGTSFNSLMDKIIERACETGEVLDLIILTSNLQVLAKGREAQLKYPHLFSTMQIILTGGAFQTSLDSLTGEFAAKGVGSDFIHPDTVFFGAAGLSFVGELRISYHFQEELSTQMAYATRPTGHRVLLCDHTKLGKTSGYKAELSIEALISSTRQCTIISSYADNDPVEERRREQEIDGFQALIRPLLRNKACDDAELALRFIDSTGAVRRELSLSELRGRRAQKDDAEPSAVAASRVAMG
jgi:DeoR/GlpR family transcriptional regulator of sugar metabolism